MIIENNPLYSEIEKLLDSSNFRPFDYSCAMLDLSPKLKRRIRNWTNENIDNNWLYWGEDFNLGRVLEPHITIMYGYHTDNPNDIVKSFSSFLKDHVDFHLGKINRFVTEQYNVLHIEVKSKDLVKLHNMTENSGLKITQNFPEYKPHITLAYLKNDKNDYGREYIGDASFEGTISRSDSIKITTSDDQKYAVKL